MAKTLAKWTVEDYHQLIEKGILAQRRVELLAGEIVEMPPEGPLHYTVASSGADYLKDLLQNQAVVRFNGPITLANSEPQPDLAIVEPRQSYRDRHPNPANIYWLIEVSKSTLEYDLDEKKQAYALADIQEYWVIDVNSSVLTVFRQPEGANYLSKQEVSEGFISPLAFSDVEVDVNRLLQGE